jgi:hypothetical protein
MDAALHGRYAQILRRCRMRLTLTGLVGRQPEHLALPRPFGGRGALLIERFDAPVMSTNARGFCFSIFGLLVATASCAVTT